MLTIVEVGLEEEDDCSQRSSREARRVGVKSNVAWNTCLWYGILIVSFLMAFVGVTD
jgi:hypothetical protein